MARGRPRKEREERPDPFMDGSNDASERLNEFISQIEERMGKVAELNEEIRELYRDANGQGFEAPIMRRVIAQKKKKRLNAEKYEREEAVFETYMAALGLTDDSDY